MIEVGCNRELLSRYRDGEVTPQEQRQIEAHLSNCPDCAATLAAYGRIGRSISDLGRLKAPASMRAEIYANTTRQHGRQNGGSLLRSFTGALALAGTAAALFLVLSIFLRGADTSTSEVLATAVYPPPGASDISPASSIEVQFNKAMDEKSVEESVKIIPKVDATVGWDGSKLVLKPVSSLDTNTTYTVTIESNAKDTQGKAIKETVVLQFSTGSASIPASTAPATLALAGSSVTPSPVSSSTTATPKPIDKVPPVLASMTATAIPTATIVDKPLYTATILPTPSVVTSAIRIGYVYDGRVNSGYTGDWPTHLQSRGYSVTTLNIRDEIGFDPEGYDLIVIGWLGGMEPDSNIIRLLSVKSPVLNGYSPFIEKLGMGTIYDPTNPGRTVYGKTVNVEGRTTSPQPGSDLTLGYSGTITVANDILYRVPVLAAGTTLAAVADEQMGVRNAPVWTVSGNKVYFGFWYSKDGTNHNQAYWTLFDRSVDFLLGRLQTLPPLPLPTPRVIEKQ